MVVTLKTDAASVSFDGSRSHRGAPASAPQWSPRGTGRCCGDSRRLRSRVDLDHCHQLLRLATRAWSTKRALETRDGITPFARGRGS